MKIEKNTTVKCVMTKDEIIGCCCKVPQSSFFFFFLLFILISVFNVFSSRLMILTETKSKEIDDDDETITRDNYDD